MPLTRNFACQDFWWLRTCLFTSTNCVTKTFDSIKAQLENVSFALARQSSINNIFGSRWLIRLISTDLHSNDVSRKNDFLHTTQQAKYIYYSVNFSLQFLLCFIHPTNKLALWHRSEICFENDAQASLLLIYVCFNTKICVIFFLVYIM